MNITKKQNGQASLEAVVAAMALTAFFGFLFCLIYLAIIYTHLRYTSHEYLLCPEYQQKYICAQDFQNAIKATVRFGQIQNLQIQESSVQRKLSFRYSLDILNLQKFQMFYEDQIHLPLGLD